MRFGQQIGIFAATLTLMGCNSEKSGEVASASDEAPIAIADSPGPPPPPPPPPLNYAAVASGMTKINHRATYEKIIGNSGISLQWISFYGADRGQLNVKMNGDLLHISGQQKKADQSGTLDINGTVVEVNDGNFIFDGTIAITGTPDVARTCIKKGKSQFAITQNRQYFRLREFEWCDSLTDYVDIYF